MASSGVGLCSPDLDIGFVLLFGKFDKSSPDDDDDDDDDEDDEKLD